MRFAYRFLVIVVLACSARLATPSASSAWSDEDEYGGSAYFVLGAGVVIPMPFLVAQIVYAAKESWLPLGWAVAEFIAGGLELFGAGFLLRSMMTTRLHVDPGYWGATIALGAVGVWLFTNAVLSIVLYERPEPPPLHVGVTPVEGGAMVGVAHAL